jgi:hypothetical protein
MSDYKLNTPVAFFIFRRPETTARVFETIRRVQPPKLLVVADGANPDRPGEAELCDRTKAIINQVDWDCEVLTNYAPQNLGCRSRVSSGLDWVFATVEEAIILEDDCLPDLSFYPFAEELLNRYRHDTRIFSITGQNVQNGQQRGDYSYYFSRYNHCWTWASWRRAWQHYDLEMKLWPEVRDRLLLADILGNPQTIKVWQQTFQMCYEGKLNTWDFQWTFANFLQNSLNIVSQKNLVTNIGFGAGGTNTFDPDSTYSNMTTSPLEFPLKHPPFMIRDVQADQYTQDTLYDYAPPLHKRIYRKLKKVIS